MEKGFGTYHPWVNLIYFVVVLGFSMFLMEPVCIAISFAGAFAWALAHKGRRAGVSLGWYLPVFAVTALVNPLFNHEGATILFYLWDGNPVTRESILFGVAAAGLLLCVVAWFTCFHFTMHADKLTYITGRLTPALGVIFSMALRFVPRFRDQLHKVAQAQRGAGETPGARRRDRLRAALRTLSAMATWALESAIVTADSMKARGYGLPGRSAFAIYRFGVRDGVVLGLILALGGVVLTGALTGALEFRYFPVASGAAFSPARMVCYAAYLALCGLPAVIGVLEERRWKTLQSRI